MDMLSVQPVRVNHGDATEHGLLVFGAGSLAAVLVCLDAPFYGIERGHWHLEAGFGRCAHRQATFPTLEAALRWIASTLDLKPDLDGVVADALIAFEGYRLPN